jgi:hypothetical protein
MKMEQTGCFETLAYEVQNLENYQEERILKNIYNILLSSYLFPEVSPCTYPVQFTTAMTAQ